MTNDRRASSTLLAGLRADWREIGGLGRLSLVGIGIAAIITVILGFSITSTVRSQLLSARAALIETAVADLSEFPLDRPPTLEEFARFDAEVRRTVLGSDTVRVKLWNALGTIVYSAAEEDLIASDGWHQSPEGAAVQAEVLHDLGYDPIVPYAVAVADASWSIEGSAPEPTGRAAVILRPLVKVGGGPTPCPVVGSRR